MDQLAATTTVGVLDADAARAARVRGFLEDQGCAVVELDPGSGGRLGENLDVIVVDAAHWRARSGDLLGGADRPAVVVLVPNEAAAAEALHAGAWDAVVGGGRELVDAALRRALERQMLVRTCRTLERQLTGSTSDEVVPLRELERRAIEKALAATRGSVEKAARMLGMGRATLYRRLATMGAQRPS